MKRKLGLIALLMVMVVLLTACGNGLEGPTWKQDGTDIETTYVFKSGKLSISGGRISMECTYKIDGNKITLNPPEGISGDPETFEFKVDGSKLTLTNGSVSQTFTKK